MLYMVPLQYITEIKLLDRFLDDCKGSTLVLQILIIHQICILLDR